MVYNVAMAAPVQVTIGTKHNHNTTYTPSKNNFYKEECGEIVDDDQYKGGDIVDNRSMEAPIEVTIGANNTQNTTDTPFNNICNRGKVVEIVDYEGQDDQDKGRDIVDNQSMAAPTQVTIGAKHTHNTIELTSSPTQVTIGDTHIRNSMDANTNKKCEEAICAIASFEKLDLVCVRRHVEASISSLSGTTDQNPPHPPAREINVNGAALQSKKLDMRYV